MSARQSICHLADEALLPDGTPARRLVARRCGRPERIVCDLCPRDCHLRPGDRGFCFVRENRDGQMVLSTYGKSTGFCIDPIEKKPLNQFYPGTSVLSFGTAGCNLGCKFCQNWSISKSREIEQLSENASPEAIAQAALKLGCRSVAFTYNDPVIWAEYAIDTAKACRDVGVKTVAVTAGYITPQARPAFYEYMDAANVDLKGFTEEFYQAPHALAPGAGEGHAPLARARVERLDRDHEPDHPARERFARRAEGDVRLDSGGPRRRTCRSTSRRFIPTSACRTASGRRPRRCWPPTRSPSRRAELRLRRQHPGAASSRRPIAQAASSR